MIHSFDLDTFRTKYEITDAAIELYLAHNGEFTFKQIAENTDLDVADIFDYFPNKNAVLAFYYYSLVIRYRLMIEEIDDFESYMLGEKISNFIYSTFDMLRERQNFVEDTFYPLIYRSISRTEFEREVQSLIKEFFIADKRVSGSSSLLMNEYLYSFLTKKYIKLVDFWLKDDSDDKELTMALTDKFTAFIQELFYSAVIDKGIELLRFMVSEKILVRNIPFIENFMNKFEIRN